MVRFSVNWTVDDAQMSVSPARLPESCRSAYGQERTLKGEDGINSPQELQTP
jgi:hypothetical protein